MLSEFGERGGIGHYWGDDSTIVVGGVRDEMGYGELENVARALSLGQKEVNLKEREFLVIF